MFEKQTPGNTFSTVPSRHLRLILDPGVVPDLSQSSSEGIFQLINDLQGVSPPVDIRFILPDYLAKSEHTTLEKRLSSLLIILAEDKKLSAFSPDEKMPAGDRAALAATAPESTHANALLSLAEATQADGIISKSTILVEARWSLRRLHRLRIIPLQEFGDFVEICAHGNNFFWTTRNTDRKSTVDTYYATTNEKCFGYFQWLTQFAQSCDDKELKDELHSALINRYSFLLYARDMVRFYEFQLDHFWRRGLMQRFVFPLGYHVTHFYLLLWGMLEQLAVIAKHACKLDLRERDCGIRKKDFWKLLGTAKPDLKAFIETDPMPEWITHMADMRHSAAHQTIPLPTMVLQETEESEKDEEYIREKLNEKYSTMYSLLPKEYIKKVEPEWIFHWRVEHMKCLLTTSVLIGKPEEKGYFRDPVESLDHDLDLLEKTMEKFLELILSFPKIGNTEVSLT